MRAASGDAKVLLLALHSRITPCGAVETIWGAKDQIWVNACKASCLLCFRSATPLVDFVIVLISHAIFSFLVEQMSCAQWEDGGPELDYVIISESK